MKLLTTFYSQESPRGDKNYHANIILDYQRTFQGKPSIFWFGDADEDVDGSPYWDKDPSGQPGTTLLYKGKPINGDIVPGIVVPPAIINITKETVMGCAGEIECNGLVAPVVVFDSGPTRKIGECSPAAMRAVNLPHLENGNGGTDEQEVLYRIWPGVAARLELNGEIYQFDLQRS